jgi:4-amino-4-deoxy-L-arabinose transferase-like glycosyltransferase
MKHRCFELCQQKWAQILLLSGFCLILYFLTLGQWELRGHDEIRYTQIAREMVEGGDWISMHLDGQPYWDKPPIFFWLIAFSSYLWQGFTSFSARFPSAFFGTLTVLLTFFIGKGLYESRTGFLSGLILATSYGFANLSTKANIDATLTFFTTAALFCFLQWYQWRQESPDGQKGIRRLLIYGFYVGMALATLTKGPVGLVLPLLISLIYLLIQKDWKGIKEMKLLPGMGLFLGIVFSWYLPAALKGGQAYLNATLSYHTVDYYSKGWDHPKPIYFYLANFPASFLPWVLFLPGAMVFGCSKEAPGKRRGFLFLLTWFIVIFLFFSLSVAKRNLYLLPLYPAASLMVGKFWGDFIHKQIGCFRREWIYLPLYIFMGLALGGGAILLWLTFRKLPSDLAYTSAFGFLALGGGLALFFLYRYKKYGAIFFLTFAITAGAFFYTKNVLFSLDSKFDSASFIFKELRKDIGLVFH